MLKKLKEKKGFTLVELIVVLTILAILASMMIPALTGYIRRAHATVDLSYVRMAKMTARASYLFDGTMDTRTYYFNGDEAVISPDGIRGYGRSDVDLPGTEHLPDDDATGIPRGAYVAVTVSWNGDMTAQWVGGSNPETPSIPGDNIGESKPGENPGGTGGNNNPGGSNNNDNNSNNGGSGSGDQDSTPTPPAYTPGDQTTLGALNKEFSGQYTWDDIYAMPQPGGDPGVKLPPGTVFTDGDKQYLIYGNSDYYSEIKNYNSAEEFVEKNKNNIVELTSDTKIITATSVTNETIKAGTIWYYNGKYYVAKQDIVVTNYTVTPVSDGNFTEIIDMNSN